MEQPRSISIPVSAELNVFSLTPNLFEFVFIKQKKKLDGVKRRRIPGYTCGCGAFGNIPGSIRTSVSKQRMRNFCGNIEN